MVAAAVDKISSRLFGEADVTSGCSTSSWKKKTNKQTRQVDRNKGCSELPYVSKLGHRFISSTHESRGPFEQDTSKIEL